jgi:hypothetical protein
VAEERADAVDDALGEDVLELARALFRVVRVDLEHLREEDLREAVPSHDAARSLRAFARQFENVAVTAHLLRREKIVDRVRGVAVQMQIIERTDFAIFFAGVEELLEDFVSCGVMHAGIPLSAGGTPADRQAGGLRYTDGG